MGGHNKPSQTPPSRNAIDQAINSNPQIHEKELRGFIEKLKEHKNLAKNNNNQNELKKIYALENKISSILQSKKTGRETISTEAKVQTGTVMPENKIIPSPEKKQKIFTEAELKKKAVIQGVHKDAERVAKSHLKITGDITTKHIVDFQKNQGLEVDGILGHETYIELSSELYTSNLLASPEKTLQDEKAKQQILKLLEDGNPKYSGYSKLVTILRGIEFNNQKKPDYNTKYKAFFDKVNAITKKNLETNHTSAEHVAETTVGKDGKTLYSMVKDGDWEGIMKDPKLLIGAGILFLFGVFGGNTKFTNTFMKRFGVVLGVAILGKPAWKHLGGDEMIADIKNGGTGLNKWYESDKMKAARTRGKEWTKSTLAKTGRKLDELKYDGVMSSLSNANSKLKSIAGNKDYIEEESFEILNSNAFAGLSGLKKEELEKINTYKELAPLLNETQKKAITDHYGTKTEQLSKDIASFTGYHVTAQLGTHKSMLDIFTDKISGSTSKLTEAAKDTAGVNKYSENNTLNTIIQTEISNLALTVDKKTGTALSVAVSSNALDSFSAHEKLDETNKKQFEKAIKKIKFINTQEEYITDQISAINKLVVDSGEDIKETPTSIKQDLVALYKIETDFSVSEDKGMKKDDFSIDSFYKAINSKKKELLTAAAGLGLTEITIGSDVLIIEGEITGIDTKVKESNEKVTLSVTLEKLKKSLKVIKKVPSEEKTPKPSTPTEYAKYIEKYNSTFKQADQILIDYKDETNGIKKDIFDVAGKIIEQRGRFDTNYKAVKKEYNETIVELQGKIDGVGKTPSGTITLDTINAEKTKLHEIKNELNTFLKSEKRSVGMVTWMKELFQNGAKGIALVSEDSAFKTVDTLRGFSEKTNSTQLLVTSFRSKIGKIESGFKVTSTPTTINVLNDLEVANAIESLRLTRDTVNSFVSESKDSKEKELITQMDVLVQAYVTKIRKSDLDTINTLYTSYKAIDKEFDTLGFSIIKNDNAVDDAYEKRKNQIEKESKIREEIKNENEEKKKAIEQLSNINYSHQTFMGLDEYKDFFSLINKGGGFDELQVFMIAATNETTRVSHLYEKLNKTEITDEETSDAKRVLLERLLTINKGS